MNENPCSPGVNGRLLCIYYCGENLSKNNSTKCKCCPLLVLPRSMRSWIICLISAIIYVRSMLGLVTCIHLIFQYFIIIMVIFNFNSVNAMPMRALRLRSLETESSGYQKSTLLWGIIQFLRCFKGTSPR